VLSRVLTLSPGLYHLYMHYLHYMYVCRNIHASYAIHTYSTHIPRHTRVNSVRHFPPHTHVLGYTFWKRGRDRREPAFVAHTRPIGREQLRDPLSRRRAVKEVRSPSPAFTGGRRSFFVAGHPQDSTIIKFPRELLFSSFRVWIPHVL
jgi:hypothetical protein